MEDFVQLLIAFMQYSSWPVAAVILAIILKKPLMNLRRLKLKDYEFEIGAEIESLSKKVKKNKKNGDWEVTSTTYLKDNMKELAETSPLAVVLQAWDIFCDTIIVEAEKVHIVKNASVSAAIQDLYEKKYVSMASMNLFFRLYALKEKMKNYENEEITKARALEYADTTLSVGYTIVKEINLHISE